MRKIILFLIIFFITVINSFGQDDGLLLKERKSGKEIIIKQGYRLKIKYYDGRVYKGKLKILNDTNIMIGNNEIAINKIEKIDVKPLILNISGGLLLSGGLVITTGGIILAGISVQVLGLIALEGVGELGYIGIPLLIGGIIITTVGIITIVKGIKNLCSWKEFRVYDWDFTIHLLHVKVSP